MDLLHGLQQGVHDRVGADDQDDTDGGDPDNFFGLVDLAFVFGRGDIQKPRPHQGDHCQDGGKRQQKVTPGDDGGFEVALFRDIIIQLRRSAV